MLGQLTTEQRICEAELLEDASWKGFVERSLDLLGRKSSSKIPPRRSRRDFVQALQVLGARSHRHRLGNADPLPRTIPIHISCPYQTWLKVFGRPQELEKYGKSPKGVPIHVWKHQCEDGPVTCIGQLSERLPGLRWVVVMRVGLYG
jgi:hypothetical protein